MFGGKLNCGVHDHKIVATYARHYSCPIKGCPNRSLNHDQIISMVLETISTLDQNTIRQHFDSGDMAKTRKHHEREIDRLETELEALRASINKVIDALRKSPRLRTFN